MGRQPLVDSATAPGYKVTDGPTVASGSTIGYSRNCSINTFVSYWYRTTSGGSLTPMPTDGSRPADMGTVTLADGRTVDFVDPARDRLDQPLPLQHRDAGAAARQGQRDAKDDTSLWNRKLLYWFQGGVAIGHTQGTVHSGSMNPDILGQGFAIVHSSGNNTGTHYNLNLAGETAMMTKERFIERYGVPTYTVGLGGSGGAIQQYMIAQNHPGVLDGTAAGAELSRHGHADHPRRRLRTARVLHGRHRPHEREVAHDQEPHLAGGFQRRAGEGQYRQGQRSVGAR